MKKLNKILALMVAVVMIITLVPANAFAESRGVQYIDEIIEVNNAPTAYNGLHPHYDITIPDNAKYHLATYSELYELGYDSTNYAQNGLAWLHFYNGNDEDFNFMNSNDRFNKNPNSRYAYDIVVIPNAGYRFKSGNLKIRINGSEDFVDFQENEGDNVLFGSPYIKAQDRKSMNQVSISGLDLPEYDASPDYDINIPADAKFRLATNYEVERYGFNSDRIENGIWWTYTETNKILDKKWGRFDPGEYVAEFLLIPDYGYRFPEKSQMTINGSNGMIYGIEMTVDYLHIITKPFTIEERANYDKVDAALAKIPADLSIYTAETAKAVTDAKYAVKRDLEISKQAEVDKMATDIENAVAALVKKEVGKPIGTISLSNYFYKVNAETFRGAYNGNQMKAVPIVKNEQGEVLKAGVDYKVTYSSDKRVAVGAYTFTVKGIGKYKGEKTCKLIITPKAVANVNVRHGAYAGGYDDAYVTWNKSEGADGYYVYMRRPNIKDNAWVSLGTVKGTSLLKKDLVDGYKYEFKVLPYVQDNMKYRTTGNFKAVDMQTIMKAKINTVKKYNNERTRLTWTNVKGVTGYQVMVSAKGNTRYFTINSAAANAKVVRNAKTTFKVRAYKDVKNNSGKTIRVYAPWSDGKTFTLR